MSIAFNLAAALVPNKRGSLFFEALKPGVDISLAMKVLDESPVEDVLSTLEMCCLV